MNNNPTVFTRHALIVLALIVVALFLWKIAPVLMLAFAGVVLAAVIRAAAEPLARRLKIHPTLSVAVVTLLALALIVGGGTLFGARIADQAQEMWDAIKDATEKVEEFVKDTPIGETVMDNAVATPPADAVKQVAKGTVTVFGALADTVLVLFLAVYFAADPHTYRKGFLVLLPPKARDPVDRALLASGEALRKWLLGQLGAMLAVGIFTFIGLAAVGVPLALPLAILSALLDFVPVIGPLVAAVPGVLIAFTVAPEVALYAALVYLVVQFIEGNLVLPLAQKWAVSLPPALSLLGIVGFGLIFGVMGVLFAMPLLVVVVTLVDQLYVKRE